MKKFLALPLLVGIALGGTSCSTSDKTCQSASGARICLNASGGGDAFTVSGSGLKPGTDVHIQIPGPGLPLPPQQADSHGKFPSGGSVLSILKGIQATTIPIDGTSSDGTSVSFVFHISAAQR
ncbi:MAG: hypothetical protein M3083_25635 [Actinomycetota bacterium]|nr:hypothetical protein [Actinomycetota bacterium]